MSGWYKLPEKQGVSVYVPLARIEKVLTDSRQDPRHCQIKLERESQWVTIFDKTELFRLLGIEK